MPINAIKEDEFSSSVSKKITLLRLFRYMLAYKFPIIVVILIMLITVGISIVNPLIIKQAINVPIANKDIKGLFALGAFALALNLIYVILVKLRMYLMSRISNKVLLTIRRNYIPIYKS